MIVQAADAADVARVVALARDTGLELAIRSGGHSPAGHCVLDGGIVLDLSAMRALDLDTEARTAWAEPGLTAGEYTTAAAARGLATGFGDTGSVGIGGITLAGGVGYLARKHGLTIDDLLAAEVVTADGQFWYVPTPRTTRTCFGRCGAAAATLVWRQGSSSDCTRWPRSLAGCCCCRPAPEVVANFIALAEAAPEELSTIASVMPAPPMPFVPAEHHGQLIIMALMVYAGEVEAGQRAITPFRSLATPLADLIKPMAYPEIYPPEDPEFHPAAVARTMFVDQVDHQAAETIIEYLQDSDASLRAAQLRVLGGAMARVPVEATAFAHRRSPIMANVASFYDGPADKPARQAWVDEFAEALHQGDDGAYVGFLTDEDPARVRQAYPGSTWDRLLQVKAHYDPTNLFHHNYNIPTAIKNRQH